MKQGLQRAKPYLLGFLVVLVVAGAILALYYWPKMQVPVCPPDQTGLPPKVCFDIENEARKTLAYIMGGILAIIGIYMVHRRIRALERQVQIGQEQLQVAQEGQITERFTRAIEQLGSDKVAIRFGGIYASERIANDSDDDYWPIMETLTAIVRAAPWRESPVALLYMDVQAILTVLGRRKYRFGQKEEKGSLDLWKTDLRRAYLAGAHLEGANFREALLEGADLTDTHLEGADLRGATGLTREQLAHAIIDEKTILPDYLQERPPEAKGPEGSDKE